jgi:hypothetical protein
MKSWAGKALETVNCCGFLKRRLINTLFTFEVSKSDDQSILAAIVLSRAINFGRQCHFKIWLDCHKFKKFPCLIIPTSTKCQKIEKKMTINVIQHDGRL